MMPYTVQLHVFYRLVSLYPFVGGIYVTEICGV